MRSICFLAIALFVSIAAQAQVTLSNPLELMDFSKPVDAIKIPTLPAPKLIGESPLGKVYAMPPDNMPCLVPNFPVDNLMPAYDFGPLANPTMPNPIPRQQFPPTHLSENNGLLKPVSKNLMLDLVRKK
jgi:hypothetical protein